MISELSDSGLPMGSPRLANAHEQVISVLSLYLFKKDSHEPNETGPIKIDFGQSSYTEELHCIRSRIEAVYARCAPNAKVEENRKKRIYSKSDFTTWHIEPKRET